MMGTPTRRAALGALIAAPFVVGAPVAALPSPAAAAFEQALAALERAQAIHDSAIDRLNIAEASYYASCSPRPQLGLDEARENAVLACSATCDALDALLTTPAPDLASVALKIELARDYGRDIDDLAPVLADLRRLGAPLASVVGSRRGG